MAVLDKNALRAMSREELRAHVSTMPLEDIDLSRGFMFQDDTVGLYFERLRRDDPVHYQRQSQAGPFWSVTRYKDIVEVETMHTVFSSDAKLGGIALFEAQPDENFPSFIAMDPPQHGVHRKAVSPIVAPANLPKLEALIRARAGAILDGLPIGEEFDWVHRVSIELTTQMLATLFDFPFEERRLLTWWSDMATGDPRQKGPVTSWEMRSAELRKCRDYFTRLWNERVNLTEPGHDLISMLAHSPSTRDMDADTYLGNVILLIIGGNDTTRNSISGGLLALNQFPEEYRKLRENPELVHTLAPEIIRWVTPLAHMRRTALADTTLGGKVIRQGDKVVMWYLSANRDPDAIDSPEQFIIDRPRAKRHLAFGFGIHHCMGNRLAEMQLRVLWEEILKRFPVIEVTGTPVRTLSNFVHGFLSMPVVIPKRVRPTGSE